MRHRGSPRSPDRTETGGSAPLGANTTPTEAPFVKSRFNDPPTQRRPSPNAAGAIAALPCKKMLSELFSSPEAISCQVSPVSPACPVASRSSNPLDDTFRIKTSQIGTPELPIVWAHEQLSDAMPETMIEILIEIGCVLPAASCLEANLACMTGIRICEF